MAAQVNGVQVGQRKRITTASEPFQNTTGTLLDPSTVTVKQRTPAGVESTLAATHGTTGIYYVDVTFDASGSWFFRFIGTGTVVASDEIEVIVSRSAFATP